MSSYWPPMDQPFFITVKYSCELCALERVNVTVPARGEEDVRLWMDQTVRLVWNDHRRRSPVCQAKTLKQLMIPVSNTEKIGGPTVQ